MKKMKVRIKKTDNSINTRPLMVDKSSGYDPFELINKAIGRDFDPTVFDLVDDRDLKLAPNFLEFCINKNFLGLKPRPMQIQMGLELFSDYCPKCSDLKFMKILFDQPLAEILDRIVCLKHGICPKCGKNRGEFVKEGFYRFYNDLAACCGQRSGKSTLTASFISPYLLHRYLKLPNPSSYFGLLRKSTVHMTYVALTYNQAYDTLWTPFLDAYTASQWFKEYNEMLDYFSKKSSTILYDFKKTYIWYDHKRILAYPFGPDKRKLRGRTRFFAATDEIGWFDSWNAAQSVKFNADEIVAALERSLRTLRSEANLKRKNKEFNALDAFMVNISSPSSTNDKIMRLVRESSKVSNRLAYHLSTWEMNPKITRKDLDDEFKKDPNGSQRDYGASPKLSSTFVGNSDSVKSMINKNLYNAVKTRVIIKEDEFGNSTQYFKPAFVNKCSKKVHVLAIDNGYNSNSFGIVGKFYDTVLDKTVTDLVCVAQPSQDLPINFPKMFKHAIVPIIKEINVKLVIFDQWQSIDFKQELLDMGIDSEIYSLVWDDFRLLKSRIYGSKCVLPKTEVEFNSIVDPSKSYEELVEGNPVTHLVYQILSVKEGGHRVTKTPGIGDDLFRAWALGEVYVADKELMEEIGNTAPDSDVKRPQQNMGILLSRGGSISNSGVVSFGSGGSFGTVVSRGGSNKNPF